MREKISFKNQKEREKFENLRTPTLQKITQQEKEKNSSSRTRPTENKTKFYPKIERNTKNL